MAINWLTVLRAVPWGQVIENAPKIADSAKRLWGSVSRTPAPEAPASATADATEAMDYAALETRVAALEARTQELHEQMLASSELIKNLAEQNAQLVRLVEANRLRVIWLSAIASVALIVTVGVLFLAFTGRLP